VTRPSWILPDGMEECLPDEAWAIEDGRRQCLDLFRKSDFGLIMPPMVEYLDSLTSGVGQDLSDQIMAITDRVSGRLMGIRPDMTPQAARIDAHALNESGTTRLCYCGSVLRAVASGGDSSRSPLQLGAEIFGNPDLAADIEVVQLALDTVRLFTDEPLMIDFGHAGVLKSVLVKQSAIFQAKALDALARKDLDALATLELTVPEIAVFKDAYGELDTVMQRSESAAFLQKACAEITEVKCGLKADQVSWYCDLGETHGFNYHTGLVFGIYSLKGDQLLVRGGRYDHVGESFGRARAATGFSADLKTLVRLAN
jgi:ATP phosphoribosyltransferase regulatory subunit